MAYYNETRRWGEILDPYRDTPAVLRTVRCVDAVNAAKNARSLDHLCVALNAMMLAFGESRDGPASYGLSMGALPTFGGEAPLDVPRPDERGSDDRDGDSEEWCDRYKAASWDPERVLAFSHDLDDYSWTCMPRPAWDLMQRATAYVMANRSAALADSDRFRSGYGDLWMTIHGDLYLDACGVDHDTDGMCSTWCGTWDLETGERDTSVDHERYLEAMKAERYSDPANGGDPD